jgi:hypothetical protein
VNTARQSPAPSPTPPADQSLEAKVRAALAKAPKAAPVKPAPRQADLAAKPVTPDASHAPADTGTVVASTPRDADPAAAAPQPLPQPAQAAAPVSAPMPIAPPQTTTIEIKSAPVVGEDAASAQPPAVDAQASAQADAPSPGKDFISAIKNFPTYLRTDTGALAPDQAPRPPRDIGVQ